MSQLDSENKKVITETESSGNGVGHSTMHSSKGEASKIASPEELALIVERQSKIIDQLVAEKEAKTAESSSIDRLATILEQSLTKKEEHSQTAVPVVTENINSSKSITRIEMDNTSLMRAQEMASSYKNEEKMPISISKAYVNIVGPYLAVSVNGVRVSIPCDGKVYRINKTHYLAARERLAKIDRQSMDNENAPTYAETNA